MSSSPPGCEDVTREMGSLLIFPTRDRDPSSAMLDHRKSSNYGCHWGKITLSLLSHVFFNVIFWQSVRGCWVETMRASDEFDYSV